MIKSILAVAVLLSSLSAFAEGTCYEMDEAASAIAKVNGATFASAAFRLPEVGRATAAGTEFAYVFNALYSPGEEAKTQKVGEIRVKALIKTGETKCKVLVLQYEAI